MIFSSFANNIILISILQILKIVINKLCNFVILYKELSLVYHYSIAIGINYFSPS